MTPVLPMPDRNFRNISSAKQFFSLSSLGHPNFGGTPNDLLRDAVCETLL
jgi:hypothetical protein